MEVSFNNNLLWIGLKIRMNEIGEQIRLNIIYAKDYYNMLCRFWWISIWELLHAQKCFLMKNSKFKTQNQLKSQKHFTNSKKVK